MLIVSIVLEVAVAVIAILAARQGRPYVYGLIHVRRLRALRSRPPDAVGCPGTSVVRAFPPRAISALVAVWGLYRDRQTEGE
jgi:hypothetical protein